MVKHLYLTVNKALLQYGTVCFIIPDLQLGKKKTTMTQIWF